MKRAFAWALAALSGLILTACGSSNIAGSGGSVAPAATGSNLASSWVSQPSKVAAIHLTLKLNGTYGTGLLNVLSTASGMLTVRKITYTGIVTNGGLTMHLGDNLGTIDAKLLHRHLILLLPGVPTNQVLTPGTRAFFKTQAARVRRHGDYLAFKTVASEANEQLSSVSDWTTKLATFAPNVLAVDVSALEQDSQQEQSNLSWVQENVGGSFSTFICIGFTGASQTLEQAQSTFAGFKSDVVAGDAESTQLSKTLLIMENSYGQLRDDESKWHFTTNIVGPSAIDTAEAGAANMLGSWPASVSEYSGQASSFMAQISAVANEAENDVLVGNPNGC